MIKAVSYPRIVFAAIWRGFVLGAALGALCGMIISPIVWFMGTTGLPLHMGFLFGAVIGSIVGFLLGVTDGLYLMAITWLCRPSYQPHRFIRFSAISISILSFLLIDLGFSFIVYEHVRYIHPVVVTPALAAAVISGWSTLLVARNIAARDHAVTLGNSETNHAYL